MLSGEPFYGLLAGMGGETLFNSSQRGSKSIGGVIGIGEVGASEVGEIA